MNAESRPLKHDHPQYAEHRAVAAAEAEAPCRTTTTKTTTTTRTTTIVTRRRALAVGVVVVAAVVAGVTYRSTGLDPRSPSGATGGVLLREGSTSTPTRATFIARYPELMDISPADQTVQYEAYLLYLNGMTVTELDAYYRINDNRQQDGGGRAGATSALINDVQQDDRGGLNVAILRGSNVQDVVEIVASASSSTGATGLADDVGDVPAGGCQTSGTSPTVFTKNMPVTPDMIYSHLSFSEHAYDKHLLGYPNCSPSETHGNCFWRRCAAKCNRDPKCRTFSAYHRPKKKVLCYLHRDWLCNKGWRYEVKDHLVVSGVCRPEPGWYTDRSCSSF